METSKWKKMGYLFAATLVLGSGIAGTGLAFAAEGDAEPGQTITMPAIADNTSARSLTVHKYKIDDINELTGRDDGEAHTVDKPAVAGVKFTVRKVKANKDGSYPAVTNPLKDTGKYEIDDTFKSLVGTTTADGSYTFELGTGLAADGVYLVEETDTSGAMVDGEPIQIVKPADPFFVIVPQTKRGTTDSLLYDINVYPKNLPNDLNPTKTIEGHQAYSIKAGEVFTWEGAINVPKNIIADVTSGNSYKQYTWAKNPDGTYKKMADGSDFEYVMVHVDNTTTIYANELGIDDTINKNLTVIKADAPDKEKGATRMQYLDGDGTWKDLNTDYYKIAYSTDTEGNTVVKADINVDPNGASDPSGALAFWKDKAQIRVLYVTKAIDDYKGGVIDNWITPRFKTPNVPPYTPPTTPPTQPSTPEYPTGGFDINKHGDDTTGKDIQLKGAEFMLASSEADANAGKFIDGLKAVTDKDGHAGFYGLDLTVNNDGTKNPPVYNADKSQYTITYTKDYWVVETKAPTGYELVKKPIKVTVKTDAVYDAKTNRIISTTGTFTDTEYELNVENKPKTELPFTGGEGLVKLVFAAATLGTIGAVGIYMTKKKENKEA